jgi:L,D-transpeptidase ErfK/SrfK
MHKKIITAIVSIICLTYYTTSHSKSFGSKICVDSPVYDCYTVKKSDTWKKLFDDEEQRELVKRINRMNTALHPGMVIAIPEDPQTTDILKFSPFQTQIDPPGKKMIVVNFDKLAFGAYDADGRLEHWGPVSGGKGYCPDVGRRCNSPRGVFSIYNKGGSGCVSTKFPVGRGGAPMPYCMFFHGGFALHGSPEVPGYNASHGCIRMFTSDAEWLNEEFTEGERRVSVILQ